MGARFIFRTEGRNRIMRTWFRKKGFPDESPREERRRPHPVRFVLMVIGLLTVLYFAIVYGLMPVLALLTRGN